MYIIYSRTGRRMSKAERKEFRQTRRNTVIDQKSQVESRINEFIKTLHTFERLVSIVMIIPLW
jgi:predicted nucleotide-binding protein (sugar kinase/HSP70/actin superfamily)